MSTFPLLIAVLDQITQQKRRKNKIKHQLVKLKLSAKIIKVIKIQLYQMIPVMIFLKFHNQTAQILRKKKL